MSHVIQVGAGSGGMVVLDLVCRDRRVTAVTLIEPDIYQSHNVVRHYFGADACGEPKGILARDWLRRQRPDLEVRTLIADVTDPVHQGEINQAAAAADLGVCAVDQEPAKYHWDELMRKHQKPWTLGEVLAGGIGGFVHRFLPGGPCYGCVASFLERTVQVEKPPAADYSNPDGRIEEAAIPASKASIHAVASLHALVTLRLLEACAQDDFTSLLWSLQCVPDVFDEAFRPYRFQIPRNEACLMCQAVPAPASAAELDAALDLALARLAHA